MTFVIAFIIVILIAFVILSSLLSLGFVLYHVVFTILPALHSGAFFAVVKKEEIEKMILLSDIKPGEKAVDLGSGDGRLVIALANAGAQACGYEINPFLVWSSRKNIKRAGLEGKAFIYQKNLWEEDLGDFDIITLFGIKFMMKKLESKLKKEMKIGSRVVSKYFTFPDWQPSGQEDNVYLYKK